MKVIIAGCRYIASPYLVSVAIELSGFFISEVVTGGNGNISEDGAIIDGADLLGEDYALSNRLPVTRYPALWDLEGKRAAGPIRNRRMAREADADALIAIWDGKSRGTRSMIKEAYAADLQVYVYELHGDRMLYLTDKAAEKIRTALQDAGMTSKDSGVRLGVRAGGCSGLSYELDLVVEGDEIDRVFFWQNIPIYCAPKAYLYLKGTTVDYVDDDVMSTGFRFDNPNTKRSCGCGTSFMV